MSELKCPACKTVLTEPLPERCPVCKLEGLNRMFLTLEDYKDWKKNVLDEHIKKLRNHKILVGAAHVLILLDNGTLFQIVDNKPKKIAEKVKSVAAGYNYSLYLDTAGKVHFLGNSGIPFKERFNQGNLVFKEVFARRDIDIFGGKDINGNFYVWGDNHSELIQKKSCEVLFNVDIQEYKKIDSEYENFAKIYGRGNIIKDIAYRNKLSLENAKIKRENLEIIDHVIFDRFVRTSGTPYIICTSGEKEITFGCYSLGIFGSGDHAIYYSGREKYGDIINVYRMYYDVVTGKIIRVNNYIFKPQLLIWRYY